MRLGSTLLWVLNKIFLRAPLLRASAILGPNTLNKQVKCHIHSVILFANLQRTNLKGHHKVAYESIKGEKNK